MVQPGPIIIIGAGIIGVSTAIWLQRRGQPVLVIDRGEPGEGASFGNGGVLASCGIVPVTVPGLWRKAPRMLFDANEPLFLRWRHLPRLAPFLMRYMRECTPERVRRTASAIAGLTEGSLEEHLRLAEGTGAERYIHPTDYFYAYPSRESFEKDAFGWRIRKDHGFSWDELSGEDLRRHDPLIGKDLQFAVRLGGHGRISDPALYVKALARHFEEQGGRILRANVTDIVKEGGKVSGVRASGETIGGSAVVVAAGAWSRKLTERLGLSVPLESERGYHMDLLEPSGMPVSPIMIAASKFVVTPMDGRIRLAGIVEFGGLDAPPSEAPFALLLRNIRAAMPGLSWRGTTQWMGHRPAIADSVPVIGQVPAAPGGWLAFGHHHIGLTAGARTGRLLASLIAGEIPNIELAPYAPSRFQ